MIELKPIRHHFGILKDNAASDMWHWWIGGLWFECPYCGGEMVYKSSQGLTDKHQCEVCEYVYEFHDLFALPEGDETKPKPRHKKVTLVYEVVK